MAFTSTYIETLEDVVEGDIDKIQYQIGGVWNDCEILGVMAVSDFRVFTCRIPSAASGLVTGLRSINSDGDVIEQTAQNITMNGTAAVSFQFKFKIENGGVS